MIVVLRSLGQNGPNILYLIIISLTSLLAYFLCCKFIRKSGHLFMAAGLKGLDYGRVDAAYIPEAVGVVAAAVYLSCLSINLVVPYIIKYFNENFGLEQLYNLNVLLAGSWSICSMSLLGFCDDVLNLKWRNKLVLPLLSAFPLLLVYIIQGGSTTTLIPFPINFIIGQSIDLGIFFYVYILMLTIFCTNSINILSGVNGLEVGQSVVIAISMILLAIIEIYTGNTHAFIIIYFLLPFIAVSLSLLRFNWYPAQIFIGDTYCYFTGMTFAVSGILGNCSKTLLLLFIPQIFNFIYSSPQLFKLFPCPRHRLPHFNKETGLREPSTFTVRVNSLHIFSCVILGLMARVGLAKITRKSLDTYHSAEVDNLTILNLYLRLQGPTSEENLTRRMLEFQVLCAGGALFARYTFGVILF